MVDRLLYKKYGYYYASRRFAILAYWMKMKGMRTPYQQFAHIRRVNLIHHIIDNMDKEDIEKIRSETVGLDPGKNVYRYGRITASACGKYLVCKNAKSPDDPIKYLQTMFDEKFGSGDRRGEHMMSPYVQQCLNHGNVYENSAKHAFSITMRNNGKEHKLEKAGFYVDPSIGIFGCTPDAIIHFDDKEEGSALLETKCPYNVANYSSIKKICKDPKKRHTFELCYDETTNTFSLNRKSFKGEKYYHQMQMQMWVTGYECTYFCVYIHKDVQYIKVMKDPIWEKESLPNLCRFIRDFYMQAMDAVTGGKGNAVCEHKIMNRELFDRLAEEGVPLNEWPEKVWKVPRARPRKSKATDKTGAYYNQ